MISRVTDPRNFVLIGVPPKDLLEDVAAALAGINVEEYFTRACSVTREWVYDPAPARLKDRIKQRFCSEHSIPLKFRTLAEVLNPQPEATAVMKRLLDWIDRVDRASQTGAPKPAFQTEDGHAIFPDDDEPWWLTDVARRAPEEEEQQNGDEDGPPSDVDEALQAEVSDDDPLSEAGDLPSTSEAGPHVPVVAWLAGGI